MKFAKILRTPLQIWSHLLKNSLMEYFIFCAVISITGSKGRSSFLFGREEGGVFIKVLFLITAVANIVHKLSFPLTP